MCVHVCVIPVPWEGPDMLLIASDLIVYLLYAKSFA